MINREDIHGDPRCPEHIAEFVRKVGGKNVFGEPMYRVVHTSNLYKKQGGNWKIWDESLSIQERGGMVQNAAGLYVPSEYKPERIEVCVKEILKYEQDGFENKWILERWVPASYFGSPEAWYAKHVPGYPNVPYLGPYPVNGDYRYVAGRDDELPELSKLKTAIEHVEHNLDTLSGDIEQMMADEMYEAQRAYEASNEKKRLEDEAFFRDSLSPFAHVSLAAGRWRNELAERAGIKEHCGS